MKLNFCPECAAPLTKHNNTLYECPNGHPYYNNPAATADVAFINADGQLLVSKRGNEPDKGKYDLPGGFVEYGESTKGAAVREIQEETGITIAENQLELLFSCAGTYNENETLVTTVFLLTQWQGEPVAADDSAGLEWKPLSFIDSPDFASSYHGLREVLEARLGILS